MASSPSRDPGLDTCLRQQEVLADLGDRALTSGDLDALCADAVAAVAETLGATRCAVIERLPDGREGYLRAATEWPDERGNGDSIPLSAESIPGQALDSTDPVVVDELAAESAAADSLLADAGEGGSAIAVAVGRPEDPWGVLVATANQAGVFSADDAPFVANVSNVIASAVEQDHARSDVEEIYGRISDAFFALDDEWRFSYLNDQARKLIAPDDRSLLGRNIWDEFPDAIEREFKPEYERAMREQETVSFEEYYPDPIDAWFEVRAYPSESGLSVYFRDVTERKEAQQQLAEERDMFAEGPTIVFRWKNEEDWPVEYVSENVEEAFGYTPAELESGEVPYTDLLLEAERDRIASEVAENSADPDTDRFSHEPYRIRTKDGDVRWVTDTTKIIRNDDGEITSYLGYLVDITERKKREEELRRYEAMIEAVDDGVYVVDENGQFTMANEAYAEMTGYDREELVGEHVSLVVDDEVLARAQQTEAAMREEAVQGVTLEAELETKGGERFPAEASFAMLPTRDGDTQRRIGVVRDITDRKKRERELERYERIVENLPVGVYRTTPAPDGEFVTGNRALASIFDADSVAELAETTVGDLYQDPDERVDISERLAEEGMVDAVEKEQVTLDGRRIHTSITAIEVEEDGQRYFDGIVQDVTAEKQRERELERYERIIENLPVGVYRNTPGPDGEFVTGNERLASIFDADSVEELMEYNVSDLYPDPEERAEFSRTLEEQGMVEDYELPQVTLDGRDIWISVTAIEVEEDGETYFDGVVQDVTDRKEREHELERFETLFKESTDVNAVLAPDGTFQYLPPSVENVLGYEQEELRGEVAFEYVHPDDRERIAAEFQRMVEDPDYRPINEFRYRHADGSWVWLSSTGRNLLEDPAIEGLVAYTRDITERKRREQQLAERERQLSTLIDNVPGMVYRRRNERGWPMEFVSDGCLDVTGYDPDALECGEISFGDDIVHEDDRERLWDEVQEGLEEDGSFNVTYRVVTPDGNVRWVRERGRRVEVEDGAERIEGVVIDITERKRLESELDEVFGRVTDAFYALDDEWRFTHVNERAEELIGYSEEELIGKKVWEPFPVAPDGEYVQELERAMETQESVSYEAYSESADIWVDATIHPSETGVSVYFKDATDRIERERDLERTERRFEAIFEDPNILVGLLDPDGTVIDINDTAMEYIDADLADVTGEPFWETPWWGEGDDVQDDVMEWTERAADGEYVDFETDLTRPNGEKYTLNGVFRPVTNDDGDVVSVIVSDRDVTERREYERQLERSERRYRTIADYFPSGIVTLFDHELEYTLAAGQGFADMPVDPEDVEGNHFSAVWGEEITEQIEPIFEGALDGEERSVELEYAGREWVVHGVPITDERDEVFAGMTMARDITERKERERELAKYETIVETINDGIYVKDEDGYFTMVNDAYAELTGYDREELLGEHASLVVDEETIMESRERRKAGPVEDEEGNPTMEAELQRADGATVPTEGTFAQLEAGDDVESIGVVRDISERLEQRRRIEESERRYRTLVENFPNGAVGLFDENLEYTAVGGEFLDQADIPKEERIGERVSEIYPEEIVEEIEPYFQAALEGEKNSFEVEFHNSHLFAYTLPVRNAQGEIDGGMLVVQDVTERRQAERELRESEARFRMLAENLDEIVWMASSDLEEFIYVNPAFEDVWDFDRDELYDQSLAFLDAVHPDDRERVKERFTDLPDERFDEEFRIVRPDGEVRWVHATGALVHDEDAEMVRIVGTGQDVTERVRRERQLEESERRYRTLAEHFPNGAVGVYDEELRYTLAEGEMLGENLPSSEVLEGDRMPDIFPPDTVADLEPMFRTAVEDGETGSTRTEFGGRHWQVWATPLRNADGEVFAGLSLAQDVTEQIERERELERALDLLEKTERIANVGGWEIDMATEDVFWTEHIFDLLEVEGEEEPPLDEALDMYHDDDQQYLQEKLDEAIAEQEPFDVEARLRTAATREERWLRLQGAPEVEDGQVVAIRGAAQDITERKKREQRLEELIERLEESNERLEQFAYAASHDLQEPLRMVSSYLQLIEQRYEDALDEDGKEFLDYAVDGADRMRNMIDGLLKYSRVDTRGEPFEPVDLDDVLADARDDLQVRIEESDAEITTGSLPTVEVDGGQVRQVLQNLLDNAIEYSGDDPPRIHVDAERRGDEWAISVTDEGIGIDPADADQIFEVFNSLHSTGEHAGTGIGLALCERIVERHGGEIWVDSEPGEGSTFTFTVPAESEQ